MYNTTPAAVAIAVGIEDTACVSDTVENLAVLHRAELLRILRARLKSEQDAEDLAQEAWARLLRYEGHHSRDELRRMLFRIANNLLTDHWRWSRLRSAGTHLPIDELEVEADLPSHERQLADQQLLEQLEALIEVMPEKRRTVFLLSRIEGLTNAQIAQRCGISIKTVEKHIAIAIAECRARIAENER